MKKTTHFDKVIQWHVNRNPQNLTEAFESAATELDSEFKYVRGRWYTHTRSLQPVMTTHGKKSYPNMKNVFKGHSPINAPVKGETNKNNLIESIDWFKK